MSNGALISSNRNSEVSSDLPVSPGPYIVPFRLQDLLVEGIPFREGGEDPGGVFGTYPLSGQGQYRLFSPGKDDVGISYQPCFDRFLLARLLLL